MLGLAGCGGAAAQPAAPPSQIALTVGAGPRFMPRSVGPQAPSGLPCGRRPARRYGAHVELFAAHHVVQVPAGIGVSRPVRRGAYVTAGRCWSPLYTTEPTGLICIKRGQPPDIARAAPTLGAFFDVWRQPLSRTRMLSFRGRVRAYLAGRLWRGDPRSVPLRRHAQVVLEVGPFVLPHPSYRFPPGL